MASSDLRRRRLERLLPACAYICQKAITAMSASVAEHRPGDSLWSGFRLDNAVWPEQDRLSQRAVAENFLGMELSPGRCGRC